MSPASLACLGARLVLLLALGLAGTGCRSMAIEAETLPFHVAVVPLERELPPAASGAPDELRFDTLALTAELAAELEGLSFTRVTRLELPPGVSLPEFEGWPAAEREAHWLAAAEACGADVLLCSTFRAAPHVRAERGSTFWGTFFDGLFKINAVYVGTGIAYGFSAFLTVWLWDLDDRVLHFEVSIDASLQALAPLLDRASETSLANRRAELVRVFMYDSDATLSFHERSGWAGHLLSLVVPGTFLPSAESRLRESLREAIGESLTEVLVQEVEFRKAELLRGNELFPFEVTELRFARTDGAELALQAEVELDTARVDRMDGYRVWVGEELVADAPFGPGVPHGDQREHYRVFVPVPGAGSTPVRLEIRDGALQQGVRTFTLVKGRTGKRNEKELEMDLPETRR
jgi:hypothetical protein